MSYCTLADLLLAMPEPTLAALSNDAVPDFGEPSPGVNEAVVGEALVQAQEMIDAYLRSRYVLPLAVVPSVVRQLAVQLARYWLYARRPEGAELPEAVVRGHKEALRAQESIRDGKMALGLPTGEAQPEPAPARVRTARRTFGRDLLERY
jgi:phage gp36-like protein